MKPYSDETKDRVLRLCAEGFTPAKIAEMTGVSQGTVRDWRKAAKIKPMARRATDSGLLMPAPRPCIETDEYGHVVNQRMPRSW